jgi:hypothetical protein
LNFGISWWNAHVVGKSWAASKYYGGWPRFVTWCGAVMAASGFTWCFTVVLAMIAGSGGWLEIQYVRGVMELGYTIVIIPILGSGLGVWIHSLTEAWRRKDFPSMAVAGWNTFAQIHNTYEAVKTLPKVLSNLGELFSSGGGGDKDKAKALMMVVALVVLALAGGILLTVYIVRSAAKEEASNVFAEMRARA